MKRFCIATLTFSIVLLSLASLAQAQYRYPPGYRPGYRPVQPQVYRSPVYRPPVFQPQPTFRPAPVQPTFRPAPVQPTIGSSLPTQNGRLSVGNPTSTPPTAVDSNDLSRQNFQNPSLDLLRRLGESEPAISDGEPYAEYPRLSGEFEPQRAMLLSISDLQPHHHGVLKELITKTSGHLPIVILVNDKKQLETAVTLAESSGANLDHVSFFVFKLDTIWLRDFGPRFLENESGTQSIDFYYDGTRPKDDQFPNQWGELAGIKNTTVEWTLQGGNLISNGQGLAFTSTRFFEDNHVRFPFRNSPGNVEYERRKLVVDSFKKECNIDRLLFLRPLTPEATKHVDMLTTFLAPDHMLIARVDPRADPVNARILDENARFLRTVKVDGRPMRVDRIDIPPRQGKYWSPYTNVIFANDLVLIPVYQSDSPTLVNRAIKTYQQLLPGKHVDTINMTSMQKLEGALHCLSINVPEFVELPTGTLTARQAQQVVAGTLAMPKPKRLLVNKNIREGRDPKPGKFRRNANVKAKPKAKTKPLVNRKPVMITGEVITGEFEDTIPARGSSNTRVSINAPKTNPPKTNAAKTNRIADQRAAANTYRRVFVSETGEFSLDAYAVALSRGKVHLMRNTDRRVIPVDIRRLSREDQAWVTKNTASIRTNGPLVRKFIVGNVN